jgi:hypothetical protein
MKQTAVDWVFEYLWENHHLSFSDNIIMQAKAMEKDQIVEAYDAGLFDGTMDDVNDRVHKQYYNETYGKSNS